MKDLVGMQASNGVYIGDPLCWLKNIHKVVKLMQSDARRLLTGGVRESLSDDGSFRTQEVSELPVCMRYYHLDSYWS